MKPKKNKNLVDTLAVTESFGLQTFRRGTRHNWHQADDDQLLARLQQLYPAQYHANTLTVGSVDWEQVAAAFGGERKAKDCRKRWSSSLDSNLRRGKWTAEEDELLIRHYNACGPLWQKIASYIDGRTEHQCSKRYLEVLDPKVRNRLQPWTDDEDLFLIRFVARHGTKWKSVSLELEGRSSLTCRNRWRNLVTSVVRGRATAKIAEEMAKVRDANSGNFIKKEGSPESNAAEETDTAGPSGWNLREPMQSTHKPADLPDSQDSLSETSPMEQDADSHAPSQNAPTQNHHAPSQSHHAPTQSHHASTQNHHAPTQSHHAPTQNHHVPSQLSLQPRSEHRYKLSAEIVPHDHPLKSLLEREGHIDSQHLVDSLVQCAAQYNLKISIHQHHHYPRSESPALLHEQDLMGGLPLMDSRLGKKEASPSDFYLEPEAQIGRFQHFNYLPPQTQVPQLTSSASSPGNDKAQTHHHHFHHHYHHHPTDNETPPAESRETPKESNILKLLNEPRAPDAKSRSLTPLTEAVQLLSAAENRKRNSPFAGTDSKRAKEFTGEEALHLLGMASMEKYRPEKPDDKPEFKADKPDKPAYKAYEPEYKPYKPEFAPEYKAEMKAGEPLPGAGELQPAQPVSQHHPLHYSGGAWPDVDEEDEELMHGYGIFFNGYVRDKPLEPTDLDFPDGLIPFNPS